MTITDETALEMESEMKKSKVKELKGIIEKQKASKQIIATKKTSINTGNVIHDEAKRKSIALIDELNAIVDSVFDIVKKAVADDKDRVRIPISTDLLTLVELPIYRKNHAMGTNHIFNPIIDFPSGASLDNPFIEMQNDLTKSSIHIWMSTEPENKTADGITHEAYAFLQLSW